ncbi:MAG: VanW family protein [Oscillospiraceae bacterium]|jgi:vancomycin resistance protein YoaR|nr:VanW family protein [Oscillospiraceae bacterium]
MIALTAGALCLGAYGFNMYRVLNGNGNTFYDGVYVGATHVGGMTREDAGQLLQGMEQQQLAAWSVTLRFPSDEKRILASHLNIQLDLQDQLEAAWLVGRQGTPMERQRIINTLRLDPYHTQGGITYDGAALESILAEIQRGIARDAVDATVTFRPDAEENPFAFTQEIYGRRLDVRPLKDTIEQCIYSLQSQVIEPQLEQIAPAVTVAQLQQGSGLIVTVSTDISAKSEPGRNENIRLALEKLNGLRVMPNEKVSFNKVVGKRTEKNGFQAALELAYGDYVYGVGGGVCQVSSTLYQAVVRAGLRVENRVNHAIPSNYAEKGQDATVSDNGLDLVFRNSTDNPIYLICRMTGSKNKRCEVSVYGKPLPEGIRYVLESEQLEELQPGPPEYKADKKHEYVNYTNEESEYRKARVGYKVATYLVEQKDGMEQNRTLVSTDIYKAQAALIYRGTVSRD